jgi:hypothetical protein
MGHVFYIYALFTSFLLLGIISKFFSIKNIEEWFDKYEKVTGKKANKEDFREEEEYNSLSAYRIINFLELFLLFGGLLTKSWYVYLAILICSLIINLSTKSIRYNILIKILSISFLVVKVSTYILLIINHFHIHFDILQYLMK